MKKRFKFILPLAASILLAACADLSPVKPTSEGGSPIRPDSQAGTEQTGNIDVVGQNQAETQRVAQLKSLISSKFLSLDKLQMTVTNQFLGMGKEIRSESQQLEDYNEGSMEAYHLQTKYTAGDESIETQAHLGSEKAYIKIGDNTWKEVPGNTKGSTFYVYLVKLILEGNEALNFQEDAGDLHVTKTITNEETLKTIFQMIEVPVFMSPRAEKNLTIDYQIDESTGEILTAHILLKVKDLGNEWQVSVRAKTDLTSEVVLPSPNFEEEAVAVDTEASDFATYFKAANPYNLYNYYEMFQTDIDGENQVGNILIGNYLLGDPYMGLLANIEEGKLSNQSFIYNQENYKLDGDQVSKSAYPQVNYYRHFVNRLIEVYDQVTPVEGSDDGQIVLREVYPNDFEEFKAGTGGIGLGLLDIGDEGTYGIDYYLDANSQVLTGIYLWVASPEETSVSKLIAIRFAQVFENNPNFISHELDSKIWDSIQNKE